MRNYACLLKILILFTSLPSIVTAHSPPPISASTSLQSFYTNKGFGGLSADGNLSVGILSFGLEFQGIAFPEHYDQPQGRIVNTAVGFSIMRYFAVEYISGGYWRTTVNIPMVRLDRVFNVKINESFPPFVGLLAAIDWPISDDRLTRYRFGLSITAATYYP